MVFPEDLGPLAGHVWTLTLGQPGGSYNNSWGEPVPALQPLELGTRSQRRSVKRGGLRFLCSSQKRWPRDCQLQPTAPPSHLS